MPETYPDGAPIDALEHLARLIHKRDVLQSAVDSAVWQLVAEGGRVGDNPRVALLLHDAVRDSRPTFETQGAHDEITEATGYSIQKLRSMQKMGHLRGPDDSPHYSGTFPMYSARVPGKGIPCVYALFDGDGELAYIGQTRNARQRLKNHWATKRDELNLTRWALSIVADGQDRLEVELALIQKFKPRGNKAGVV